jgi:hypothetical protein
VTPDTEILAFAVRWLPFGGAPGEDVYVTFGLTHEQFRRRLADALAHEQLHMAPATAVALATAYRL